MPKILLALTSNDKIGDTDRKTGFYVPEAAHPYRVFTAAGYDVEFVSVKGGEPPKDGVKAADTEVAKFLHDLSDRLTDTATADQVDAADYDAIFYVGGHGTMWDFPNCEELAKLAAGIYARGGVVAAVCHGPAGLVNIQLDTGAYLVNGKQLTAFSNEEETIVGLAHAVPFLLESRLIERGARFSKVDAFAEHAVADGRLITGQNPASATKTAELVVQALRSKTG